VLERNSALVGVLKSGGRDGPGGERRLRVGEARGRRLVQVAALPGAATALATAVRPVLGTDLPSSLGEAAAVGLRLFLKVGPEQFWIISPDAEDVARALESVVSPTVGSVTPLSHSRTCIWIDGPSSREVLATGIAVDLHPDVFHRYCFALTGLHHTPLMILRSGESRYELYALRTFALWTWEWLIDAALPFGYDIIDTNWAPPAQPRASGNGRDF
jgi:heterotetrameric sarcosine oxidase gamma subunit